jgi:glycosyltransferase involved in cell wall biosynthesis
MQTVEGLNAVIHYMTIVGVRNPTVGNELRVVTAQGIPVVLHALGRPEQVYFDSADIAALDRETQVIYPLRPLRALVSLLKAPGRFGGRFFSALWNALTGRRENRRVRLVGLWHFVVACHWAGQVRNQPVSHIHAQWIHSPGTVAYFGAWLLGRPFSFTGHAADLFRDRAALSDKIGRADFIVCISEFHRQFYIEQGAAPEKLVLSYCGIDTTHFTPALRTREADAPFHILSSGRLVEKKGFEVLIRACALLAERGLDFRCTIGGEGPLEAPLRALIAQLGLEDRVTVTGAPLRQEELPDFMRQGDAYCLACVQASDNDVDGLPQMLMEAMACGLPAVSTQLVGIPDLVRHGETGLLVAPGEAAALADALARLEADPGLAARLASAGRAHVEAVFALPHCLDPLVTRFRAALEDGR